MTVSSKISLSGVQKHRKRLLLICGISAILLFSVLASADSPESPAHEAIEAFGFALILLCILGRTWCTLYIGGRKKHELMSCGPYSVVRNPLYVFSLLGAAGVGLTTGSIIIGVAVAISAFLIFNTVVRSEEAFLAGTFQEHFGRYAHRVPRWIPRFSEWRDQAEIVVRPKLVLFTFRDACLFLIAVPLFEEIDYLQTSGILPVILHLP